MRTIAKILIPERAYKLFVPYYHFFLAFLASVYYQHPSRDLIVIGVTGTDGKTTLVHMLHEIFEAAGLRTASASSLRFKIHTSERINMLKMTMPGRFELQKFFQEAKEAKCRFAIIEVTSEGIAQNRHKFIHFAGAVLTNITPEHIESHGSFEAYREAKLRLFRSLSDSGVAVLNREDASYELAVRASGGRISSYTKKEIEILNVGRPVRVIGVEANHIQLEVEGVLLDTKLGGEFNVMNMLAAIATALSFGVSLTAIQEAFRVFKGIPGRLEYVIADPFHVVVDYANTPHGYDNVYKTLSEKNTHLICVFGSPGGGRDRWKRPVIGEIASRYCSSIILTSDDPDDEDPAIIASEIQAGIPKDKVQVSKIILDRRGAIRAALGEAKPGDTVIITGMGAQPWFIGYGGKRIPWDERAIVKEEFLGLNQGSR